MLRPLVHGLNRPLLTSLVERAAVGGTVNQSPVAGFSVTPTLLSVQVTDTSSDDHGVTGYDYDWGDSSSHATTQNPGHTYTLAGTYTIVQTVTDGGGKTAQASHSVTVDITKDGPSSTFRVPQSAADFVAIGVTAPTDLYLMQEASSNLADSLAAALTLTAAGSVAYQQAVTSWTRKAVQTAETAGQKWTVNSGSGPNPASTSVAFGFYFTLTGTPGGTRDVAGIQGANGVKVTCNGSRQLIVNCLSVTTTGASAYTAGTVYRAILVYNRTAGTVKLFTDLETITGTYGAGAVDGVKGFGNLGGTAPGPLKFLLGWIASGAAAESYNAATLGAM